MRFIISFVLSCIMLSSLYSSNKDGNDTIYTVVEQMPQFPEGDTEMTKFISTNLKYPSIKTDQFITESTSVVRFIVRKSGKITDIEIVRSISKEYDNEIIELIRSMPEWKPAILNGEKVSCYYTFPIRIRFQK